MMNSFIYLLFSIMQLNAFADAIKRETTSSSPPSDKWYN